MSSLQLQRCMATLAARNGGVVPGRGFRRLALRPKPPSAAATPADLLKQALAVVATDQPAAEKLLRQAILQSGGDYDDAELALATVLAAGDNWNEAAELFETASPEKCRSELLLSFGRQAQAAGNFPRPCRFSPSGEREGPSRSSRWSCWRPFTTICGNRSRSSIACRNLPSVTPTTRCGGGCCLTC